MISLRKIINLLFVISFTNFGICLYLSRTVGGGSGFVVIGELLAIMPYILILFLYLIIVFIRRKYALLESPLVRINTQFYWVLAFFLTIVFARIRALHNGVPFQSIFNITSASLIYSIPFLAFIVFFHVNSWKSSIRLLLYALAIYVLINLAGFAAGLTNASHSLPGRLNLPFGNGFYNVGNVVMCFTLLLFGGLLTRKQLGINLSFFISFIILNCIIAIGINSRTTLLVVFLVSALWLTRIIKWRRIIFAVSWLILPALLAFSDILYEVLRLPVFKSILSRVSYKDVTQFNGRRPMWEAAIDWFTNFPDGIFMGNGYKGALKMGFYSKVHEGWIEGGNFKGDLLSSLHLHSSMLEYGVSQGLIGLILFGGILFIITRFYLRAYLKNQIAGMLYPVSIFLLFISQIDIFAYEPAMGIIWIMLLAAPVVIKQTDKLT